MSFDQMTNYFSIHRVFFRFPPIKHIKQLSMAPFYTDDGEEINPDLIKKPGLSMICLKDTDEDPEEEMLCILNRIDQRDSDDFICYAFEKR
jgi:hypothetical protein